MKKSFRSYITILFLGVLFLTPLFQVISPGFKLVTISSNVKDTNDNLKVSYKKAPSREAYSSGPNAQFNNLTLEDYLTIRFDSNVVMDNAHFSKTRIYLYNNSKLVLRNATFEDGVRIFVYDNAKLLLDNGTISTSYVLLYGYDYGSIKITNSYGDYRITLYESSNIYIQNASINMLLARDYSTSTILSSSSTGNLQFLENSSSTMINFTTTAKIYLNDETYLYAEKLTIVSQSLYLYDSSHAFIKNSTIPTIQTDLGSDCYTTIVNSSITALYYKSEGLSHIYNSTIDRIFRSFIVDGSALFEGTKLYKKGGSIQYNIILDNDTTVSYIYNYTNIYLMPGSNLNITSTSLTINYVKLTSSTATIKDASLSWLYAFNSDLNIVSSSLSYPYISGGTLQISNSNINTAYFYGDANIIGENLTISSVYHYDNVHENMQNVSISSTFSIQGGAVTIKNSSLTGLQVNGATFTGDNIIVSIKNIEIIESTFTLTNSKYTSVVLSQSFTNTTVYINNLTASNIDLDIASSNVTIVDAHSINGIYPVSSTILIYNSTINSITGKANDNSDFYIRNCTIVNDLFVGYYGLSAEVYKSSIKSAHYIINVTKGTVELNNFRIIGNQDDYITTLTFDDETNITNLYIRELNVKNAVIHIANQTLFDVEIYNSEAYLFNVTIDLLIFNGSSFSANQCDFDTIAIGYATNLQINGSIMSEIYVGMGSDYFFNTSNGLPYPLADVYGNITFSTISGVLLHLGSGSIGVSNSTVGTIASTTDGHLFLYNDTITVMYQSYIFENGGSIYGYNDIQGFNSTAVYNITGNKITSVRIAYVTVYSGVLTINDSFSLITAYNDSKVYALNNSQIAGLVARDSAYIYIEDSQIVSADISSIVVLDNSKVVVNESSINQGFFVHDNAQFEIYNTRIYGNVWTDYYIHAFGNSNLYIFNSTATGSGVYGFIRMEGTSKISAIYFNVTLSKTAWYTPPDETFFFEGYSYVVWNHSYIMVQEALTPVVLRDFVHILFYNVTFNATYSQSYYSINVVMYNSTSFNGTYFKFIDASPFTYTTFNLYDSSSINLETASVEFVYIMDESSAYLHNFNTTQIFLMSNASMTLLNDGNKDYVISYVYLFMNSSVTIDSATLESLYVYGGFCSIVNVHNSTSSFNIYVSNEGRLTANNITANNVLFNYLEPTQPYPTSEIVNSSIDTLTRSLTFHRSGNVTFTGHSFTASPATIEFQHISVSNTIIGVDNLIVNFKDNLRVSGSDANFTSMYIGIVNDTTSPVISITPTTLSFEKGLKDKKLTITITEMFPDMYQIYRNGSLIQQGFYKNEQPIILDVTGFDVGNWVIEVFANDTTGNHDTATAHVTVYPNEAPEIISSPPDTYEMIVGTTGNSLSWTAVDHSPAYFLLYVNGQLEINDTWSSNDPIEYIIDSFAEGTYNVTIVFYDLLGNKASDTVTVSVTRGFLGTGLPFQTIVLIVAGIAGIALVIAVILRIRKTKKVKSKKAKKTKKSK
ncbi:MAG: hypothetical protein ACP6IS_09820 [Candidatus Asgardarchaeia archaeon]